MNASFLGAALLAALALAACNRGPDPSTDPAPTATLQAAPADPYATLGVPRTATAEDITKAFNDGSRRARAGGSTEDQRRYFQLALAYHILGDPERRAKWDAEHPF